MAQRKQLRIGWEPMEAAEKQAWRFDRWRVFDYDSSLTV